MLKRARSWATDRINQSISSRKINYRSYTQASDLRVPKSIFV